MTAAPVVSIPQWAGIAGLADDGRSLATASRLIAKGEGPETVKVNNRSGVRPRDHAKWARSHPWAKYLAAREAAERAKCERYPSYRRIK